MKQITQFFWKVSVRLQNYPRYFVVLFMGQLNLILVSIEINLIIKLFLNIVSNYSVLTVSLAQNVFTVLCKFSFSLRILDWIFIACELIKLGWTPFVTSLIGSLKTYPTLFNNAIGPESPGTNDLQIKFQ